MATPEDIVKMTAVLSAAFPNWKITEWTNEVYYQDLKDIPADELMIASQHCRAQPGRAFAPSTGEIRGAVMELRALSNNVPSSSEAWNEFKRAVMMSNYSPEWSHPLIGEAARLIGARDYGQSNVDDEPSWRARFIQFYDQLVKRSMSEAIMIPEVRGYVEARGAKLLAPMDQIKQLSEGMRK